jgi:lambda family phage portal protein
MKKNAIDKFAEYVSPSWAKSRDQDRREMEFAAMAGGYDGASSTSAIFENFLSALTDADSSVLYKRSTLVERSRDNVRNSPVATGLIKRICDHAIGPNGLTLQPLIDQKTLGMTPEQADDWQEKTESEWRRFSESIECDYARTQNFPQKTYLTLQSMLEGGDCFTLFTNLKRKGSDFDLKLQSIEGERVNNKDGKPNSEQLYDGVKKDKNGVAEAYQISKYHPGNQLAYTNTWTERKIFGEKTGRRNILQHYNQLRFGQTRGIPVLGPVTGKLLQIQRLSDAELLAAVVNSFYTIVIKGKPADTKQTMARPPQAETPTDDDKLELGSGSTVRINEDVEFDSFDPKRPNHLFEPFFKAMVAEIGAAVGVPKSLILMEFDKSYSASRGEVLLAWVYFLSKRNDMITGLCQPTYEAFLDEQISKGNIIAPGYFIDPRIKRAYAGSAYSQWTGPVRPAIDEMKEAQANQIYHDMETQSLTEITAKTTGKQWKRQIGLIKKENEIRGKQTEGPENENT